MHRKKLTEIVPEESQTWCDLQDKDFKSTVLNMLKELKETRRTMSHQIETNNKVTEIIKRNQT